MNSLFKFPRRVRIHGGECGAVARALHHEAQKGALVQDELRLISDEYASPAQAGLEKAFRSTSNERKQMSTKTSIKRIALVAVSALGFGLISVVPAKAAGYTSGLTLGWSALTVVDANVVDNYGFFYVDSTNLDGATATAAPLEAGESIRVTVTGAPTGQSVADLDIYAVTNAGAATTTAFADCGIANDGDEDIPVLEAGNCDSPNSSFSTTAALNNESNRYWFAVRTSTATSIGAGKYTLRIRLANVDPNGAANIDYTMTVKFVETIADAGATLTLAKTGVITKAIAFPYTSNSNVRATLRDADGGRIHIGQALTGARTGWDPALNANLLAGDGTVGEILGVDDNGVTTEDLNVCGTGGAAACGATPGGGIAQTLSQAILAAGDGVYGVYDAGVIAATASNEASVRVRVTDSSVSSTIAIPVVVQATSEVEDTLVLLTATGIPAAQVGYRAVVAGGGQSTLTYTLPVSTTSATLTFDTDGVGGQYYTSTVTWGGNFASTAVSPASTTASVVYSDSDGKFSQALTNTTGADNVTATVKIVGFDDPAHSLTVTLTWAKAAITALVIADPIADIDVKTSSVVTYNVLAFDQFGNAVAGEQIRPSISGTTSANYSATTTYAPITTNASGLATWTLTAGATTATSDTVVFTSLTNGAVTTSITVNYVSALPTAATLLGYFSDTFGAAATAITAAVPTAGIGAAGGGVDMVEARDLSRSLAANPEALVNDMIALRVRATTSAGVAAEGAAMTLTAGPGGHVLNSSGLPASSRTIAVDANGDAVFQIMSTSEGAITFTATSGSVTATYKVIVADQDETVGRTVTISGGATGTANGEGVPMTVAVKDRYGNGVKGVTLTLTATGVGAFMGGATTQSITTDNSGTFTFLATSYASAGGKATYTASANNAGDATSLAGFVGVNPVDSTLAAGVKSASADVTYTAGTSAAQAAAEAASDAAAEAIDAANAATDAANLAAEAADAATVAAEEARDAADAATAAVEELATQVATLMAALKAQITTLANTVAKIAKKVKA